jgi:hypothetical protein
MHDLRLSAELEANVLRLAPPVLRLNSKDARLANPPVAASSPRDFVTRDGIVRSRVAVLEQVGYCQDGSTTPAQDPTSVTRGHLLVRCAVSAHRVEGLLEVVRVIALHMERLLEVSLVLRDRPCQCDYGAVGGRDCRRMARNGRASDPSVRRLDGMVECEQCDAVPGLVDAGTSVGHRLAGRVRTTRCCARHL